MSFLRKFNFCYKTIRMCLPAKGLPPHRTHNHPIILQLVTKPISVRPYRYPFFQKDEIEKIVREMLTLQVIQQSQSLYSFTVLLVRKADDL